MRACARLLSLAALSLACACGGTIYTAEGLPPLGGGKSCDALTQLDCPGQATCVARTTAQCEACGTPCGAAPPHATMLCRAPGPGLANACVFECDAGYLRNGASSACEPAAAIAAGAGHTCAVTSSGLLKCWGDNTSGQVTGGPSAGGIPVPHDLAAGVDPVLAAGSAHTCAAAGGVVSCWPASAATGMPSMSGVVALSAGATHTCAIANGATTRDLRCWGSGLAVTSAPSLAGVTAIASGADHACAVRSGGVTCWGRNDRSQTGGGTPVAGGSGIDLLAAGADFTCAASKAGTDLVCWGDNSNGQLPQLANPQATAATPLRTGGGAGPITKSKSILTLVAGARHTCLTMPPQDGVGCFGEDAFGKLGGAFAGELVVQGAASDGALVLTAGGDHSCAVFPTDGLLRCWGRNDSGQLGNGTVSAGRTAAPVLVSGK